MTDLFNKQELYEMQVNSLIGEAEKLEEEMDYNKALLFYQIAEEKTNDVNEQINLLLKIGLIYQLMAKDNKSILCYEKAEKLSLEIKDNLLYGKANLKIGEIKEKQGQWDDALKNYNNSCEAFISDEYHISESYLALGKLFEKKCWYETGIEWYEKSRKIFQECNNETGKLLAEVRLASIYFTLGKREIAEQYLESCKKVNIENTDVSLQWMERIQITTKKADLFKDMASIYQYLGMWSEALQWFEKSYRLYDRIGYVTKKIDTAISISILHFNQKNWSESEYLLKITEETAEIIDEINIPHIYASMGWAFLRKGDLKKAARYLERGREIAEKNKNLHELLELLFALARLYLYTGKWIKIKLIYDKVIDISNHLKSTRTLAIGYNNLGYLFMLQGENEKAFKFLSVAKDTFEKIEHYRGLADSYDNTAMLYKNMGQDDWVLYCLERAMEIRSRVNSEIGLGESYLRLAVFFMDKGHWNQAKLYFEKNLSIWKKADSLLEADLWNIQMLYYYIKSGQKEKAEKIVKDERLEESLKEGNYSHGLRLLYNGKAYYYFTFKDFDKAKHYYQKVLQITLNGGFVNQLPDTFGNLARFYEEINEIDMAIQYLEKKKELEHELGLKSGITSTYEGLSRIYSIKAQSIKKQYSYHLPLRSDVISIPPVYPVSMEFGRELLPFINLNSNKLLVNRITSIRQHIASELGIITPEIHLIENLYLGPDEYIIQINGVTMVKDRVNREQILAVGSLKDINELHGAKCVEQASGLPAIWIKKEDIYKAEEKNCIILDPVSVIACNLTETIRLHLADLLDRENTYELLNNFGEKHPIILDAIYPSMFSLGEIQKILKNLLKERVSIRNLKAIIETLSDYGRITGDEDLLTEYVRIAIHREICSNYINEENTINVIALDKEIEDIIGQSLKSSSHGYLLILEPSIGQKILVALSEKIEILKEKGIEPVILCNPSIRPYFRRLTERSFSKIPVIAHSEVPYNVKINIEEKVSIN